MGDKDVTGSICQKSGGGLEDLFGGESEAAGGGEVPPALPQDEPVVSQVIITVSGGHERCGTERTRRDRSQRVAP